jgi:hypothetical protein
MKLGRDFPVLKQEAINKYESHQENVSSIETLVQ